MFTSAKGVKKNLSVAALLAASGEDATDWVPDQSKKGLYVFHKCLPPPLSASSGASIHIPTDFQVNTFERQQILPLACYYYVH